MKKRILSLSIAAALVLGAMASCTQPTEDGGDESVEARDISLVMWASEKDQSIVQTLANEWAEQYAADNADINSATVDVQIVGEDDATTQATKDLTAAADVFGVPSDQLSTLKAANAIYALTDNIVSQISETVTEGALASTAYEGTYYIVPYSTNTAEVLYYNTSIYTEDEVKSLNTMLDKDLGGVINVLWDVNNAWNGMTWFATAGIEYYTNDDITINTLNNENVTAVLTWLQEQGDSGTKKIGYCGEASDATSYLADGKAAACAYGSWASSDFEKALGDNFGVVELPTLTVEGAITDQHMICFGGCKGYVVNAQSEEAEASMSLALYCASEDAQLRVFKENGRTPIATSVASNEEVASNPTVAADAIQAGYTINNTPVSSTADWWNIGNVYLYEIFTGKTSAADIQAKLDELVATMQANVGADSAE